MSVITVSKGHDLRISGIPSKDIQDAPRPAHAALQPPEFRYLRPRLKVREGDSVKIGTPLFESKDDPRIVFVSPAAGKVSPVRFGERRRLLEVVVELGGEESFEEYGALTRDEARGLSREALVDRLLKMGLWPLLRQRPFSKIADPDGRPAAIFVSATAAGPCEPDADRVLEGREQDFQLGLDLLKKLTEGPLHLCCAEHSEAKALIEAKGVSVHRFNGKHQAGDAAVQIYHVAPPSPKAPVWYLGYQDLLTISRSLAAGRLIAERVVGFGGPGAAEPKTLRTRIGASVESITRGKVRSGEMRYVSGAVLNGTAVDAAGHLGFYDSSLIVLPEGRGRELLGFARPGFGRYSLSRAWISAFFPGGEHDFDTNLGGSRRNFVLQGVEEDLCPVGIWPQQAAKAVLAEDFDEMEKHGVLDCAECGLCTFVCPSKIEVAGILRRGIDMIHKEG